MKSQLRIYDLKEAIVFRKTNEEFGGLSNMAGGYTLSVNGVHIRTSEALYQLCRFPEYPEIQKMIIEQRSPMTAKMKVRHAINQSRDDWTSVRVKIMRWCLRVKLAQNFDSFGGLLERTGSKSIVESSRTDSFWGATPKGSSLVGVNCLGRLLMELRDEHKNKDFNSLTNVSPIKISNFLFLGQAICSVTAIQKSFSSQKCQKTLFD